MFMKNLRSPFLLATLSAVALSLPGCFDYSSDDNNTGVNGFKNVPLVSDSNAVGARMVDSNLSNPWGLAVAPNGNFWIADNHTGMSSIYDPQGTPRGPAVRIPGTDSQGGGAPTGIVYNPTSDFNMPTGRKAVFLFAGEDGVVTGWDSGSVASILINRSGNQAVYKGMALASDAGRNFLYLANFKGRKVEVFDANFQMDSTKVFADTGMLPGYGPFNIQSLGSQLYVTYAKLQGPEGEDDQPGPGNGFIDVFTTGGVLVRRFATGDSLNSPWGIAPMQTGFGPFRSGVLIGNFGDGRILAYDNDGNFQGSVSDSSGAPIKIDGLWALYRNGGTLYYTAGPNDENNGIFGYLSLR